MRRLSKLQQWDNHCLTPLVGKTISPDKVKKGKQRVNLAV
jgi:hypothetical protein